MSDTAAALVADDLPAGATLTDLGAARLRDLARPERVWQLDGPGIDTGFPPLRALEAPPHNLPAALSSLVGRDRELADVAALLDTNRLVTLAGSGGVGKTRLVQQAAVDALDRNPGGTWWIELASITAATLVAERLAAVIGVGSGSPSNLRGSITRHLRSTGPTLVVLDNAEHLVETVADLAKHLLEACPDLRILVTSREPLGIAGEVVWRVPSLPTPPPAVADTATLLEFDAARLFVERARHARPNLALDADATSAIASICARLDGIPLAIELAAARARNLPLDRLASGLDDAFRLLTGGDRTATARQQTLLASIAWSVDLLDEREETVLRRLAVFTGSFTLEAAEAVTTDDSVVDRYDVIDALGQLVDKSLVQFDDTTSRYRLLDTVRQFGLDRLRQHDELSDARTRHAGWCVAWTDTDPLVALATAPAELMAMVPDLVAALDWTTTYHPDLALRICAGQGPMLTHLGPSTCHRLVDWMLALDHASVDWTSWVGALAAVSGRAVVLMRPDVYELIPVALADPSTVASPWGRYLQMLVHLPDVFEGRFDAAERLCAETIAAGESFYALRFAGTIGSFGAYVGHLDIAHRYLPMVAEILERNDLPWNPVTAGLGHSGSVHLAWLEGRLAEARDLSTTEPSPSEYAFISLTIAVLVGVTTCDDALWRAAARSLERNDPPDLVRVNVAFARLLVAIEGGDPTTIGDAAASAWSEFETSSQPHMGGLMDATVVALIGADRGDDAAAVVQRWQKRIGDSVTPINSVVLDKSIALLARHQGRDADAVEVAHQQLQGAHSAGLVIHTIDALIQLADLAARRGDDHEASRLIGATTAVCDRIGYRRPILGFVIDIDGLAERLRAEQPDAFAEGARLDLGAAVELAQRSRGPRGRPVSGWASLTPTERLVAEQAASGATNAQIAEKLLIAVPTVKAHLTRTFTKLDVANRTELASAFAARGRDAHAHAPVGPESPAGRGPPRSR